MMSPTARHLTGQHATEKVQHCPSPATPVAGLGPLAGKATPKAKAKVKSANSKAPRPAQPTPEMAQTDELLTP